MWKLNLKIFVASCMFMTALTGPPAEGKTISVANDGRPCDFISIQPAIDFATGGDEIEVWPGTYYEAINFGGKAVRLYSNGGPEVTIIDANGAYHAVQCVSNEDANTILEGFTITGGAANGPMPKDQQGGGMYNYQSSPTVINCTFSGNSGDGGGGMFNIQNNPTVTNCTFIGNTASFGGGMFNSNSSLTVTNCTFSDNSASVDGGGMYNFGNSPTVTSCIFTGNTAEIDGGGMYNNDNSSPTVTNCTFSGNSASDGDGGGMHNYGSSPTLTNCTFSKNICFIAGGGMLNNNGSNPTVTNCILWGNTPDQIVDQDFISTTSVFYSDVQGGWPEGVLVIDADPCFVDAAGGDLRLSSSASPCVDTGANVLGLPATDLAGKARIVDGDLDGTATVDMGAYEFQCWLIHNITQDIWYETIQLAINDANNGDEIEVSPGTYYEAIDFGGMAVRVYSSGGPEVTIIDANGISGAYHVVQCVSGEDANTILEGFTITGGNANGTDTNARGGGMYNEYTNPTVRNCIFTNNSAIGGGGVFNMQADTRLTGCTFSFNSATSESGGLHNHECDAIVTNCTFVGNTSVFGGAMSNPYSSPTVSNCTFLANTASEKGGGMYNRSGSRPTVTNCTFSGNTASSYGGGMYNDNSVPTVTNCVFNHNEAEQASGGGIANYINSHSTVTNCTFSGNTTGGDGGGIRNWDSNPIIKNCILWGNEHNEISSAGTSEPVVNYSDIRGGHIGTGNIETDPNFVDANNPDPNLVNLRLLPASPCIDAGDTTAVPIGIFVDLDGNPRGLDDPASSDTGVSVLGVTVDMGAYEFQPCPIAGDINCDGVVDFKDVAILCNNWLAGTEPEL